MLDLLQTPLAIAVRASVNSMAEDISAYAESERLNGLEFLHFSRGEANLLGRPHMIM